MNRPESKMTKPFGLYAHARRCGPICYLAGQGCREPETDDYPGTKIVEGRVVTYDIREQTRGVFANIERALSSQMLSREHLIDIQVFLKDMKDFEGMNEVWAEFFKNGALPTRTTICVKDLPGHNQIEMKAIAFCKESNV